MLQLFKNKIKDFSDITTRYLSRSKKNRRILLAVIPIVGGAGFFINFILYTSVLNKTKTFFKNQFYERVNSDILMANSFFRNYTNSLAYEIRDEFFHLPQGTKLDYVVAQKAQRISTKYNESIKKVIFVNFFKDKCDFIYPQEYRKSFKNVYSITDHSNMVIKNPLSRNFIYVYIPNPHTEKVDSCIWGIITQDVKIRKRLIGRIFFIIDVAKIIGMKVPLYNGKGGGFYRISILSFKKINYGKENPKNLIKWDNAYLRLTFVKNQMAEIPWITRYRTVKKYLFYFSFLIGVLAFLAFSFTIIIFVSIGSKQQEEMEELYRQRAILNFIIDNLKKAIQTAKAEELVIIGLKSLIEYEGVEVNVYKGGETIFSANGGGKPTDNCPTVYTKGINQLCKIFKIGKDKFKVHLKFDKNIDEKEFVFYSILIEVIIFAANFSNEYMVRRSVESNTFKSILKLLGAKDNYTCDHSVSVSAIATFIAEEIGVERFNLDTYDVEVIKMAGYLHDIGKMGIPDEILNKLGHYNEAEMDIMRLHPKFTEMIIKPLAEHIDFYRDVLDVAVHHHERLDGSGYPHGLKGEEFTIQMQILAISDILDAMMRDRPYKQAKSDEEIIKELRAMISGAEENWKFNPELVEVVISKFQKIKEIPDKIDKSFCEIDIQ